MGKQVVDLILPFDPVQRRLLERLLALKVLTLSDVGQIVGHDIAEIGGHLYVALPLGGDSQDKPSA